MQFIQTARLILTLLPLILEAVKVIEAALPESGRGAEKLALIRAALESAFATAADTVGTFEQIWPALQSTVAAVVGLFNSVGLFRKSGN
jgi:hypothetical protein